MSYYFTAVLKEVRILAGIEFKKKKNIFLNCIYVCGVMDVIQVPMEVRDARSQGTAVTGRHKQADMATLNSVLCKNKCS